MLDVVSLSVSYGGTSAVRELTLSVPKTGMVGLIGPNGAGKSSTLKAISRLIASTGSVSFDGVCLGSARADAVARMGLMHVPEGRRIFPTLTVDENIRMGLVARRHGGAFTPTDVYDLFPPLGAIRSRRGWALSGGEQQMVAIGRALVANPRMLMLDEPSLGLAPVVVHSVFAALDEIASYTPVLLVEQNTTLALQRCAELYVLVSGRCVLAGSPGELGSREELLDSYLGISDVRRELPQ